MCVCVCVCMSKCHILLEAEGDMRDNLNQSQHSAEGRVLTSCALHHSACCFVRLFLSFLHLIHNLMVKYFSKPSLHATIVTQTQESLSFLSSTLSISVGWLVGWLVCQQDYTKTTERTPTKLGWGGWGAALRPEQTPLTFSADPEDGTDPVIFPHCLWHFYIYLFIYLFIYF